MAVSSNPIFVVGAPRSGTTLISQILSKHSDIYIFNETLIYDTISSKGKNFNNKQLLDHLLKRLEIRTENDDNADLTFGCMVSRSESDKVRADITSSSLYNEEPAKHSDCLSLFMENIIKYKNKNIWGEKTPNHIYHLKRIKNDYPNARIIHIIRDPHTFIRSYKYAWRRAKNNLDLYHPIITSILWRRSIRTAIDFSRENDILEIRYEDLVQDMARHTKEACNYIGIEYQPHMISIEGNNSSFKSSNENTVPLWENKICDFICRKEITRYNYKPASNTRLPIFELLYSILLIPSFIIRIYPVVLKNWGGITNYIKSRL